MPFTLLFPNLRRIWIEVDVAETGSDVHFVKLLAQHAGFNDWKDYVTMRERGVLEVVEFTLISNKEVTVYKGRVKFDRGLAPHALALLTTCRQIYIESRLVFYSGNNFKFPYDTFLDRYWAGKCALSREQLETIQSVVLYKSWIYFWNGRQWEFPWTACMRTFPNLKKIALQGVTLTFMLERDAVVGGSTTWVEYLGIQKGIKLEVITEDHSGPE
ncbi:uncharacterized protein J4E78_004825 [Alternaria triticimaculans]|uniref:uncharacterized protein n=1 Tax=Alternaria triticimaculans TaxID=297637 RepID=UPI0020C4C035|nr:uncharacterized protein J4E78_004825 [Alternaria triticimaculans]KAI4662034.1 hypothetical protein J4E78_004825 [Alternaria triticimaculans]